MTFKKFMRLSGTSVCLIGLIVAGAAQARAVSHAKDVASHSAAVVAKAGVETSAKQSRSGAGLDIKDSRTSTGLSTHGLHCAFFPVINRWICEPMNY